jgi:endoplasmic reticulum Man9GlcNAc2 1,2-alpha-mannosidase
MYKDKPYKGVAASTRSSFHALRHSRTKRKRLGFGMLIGAFLYVLYTYGGYLFSAEIGNTVSWQPEPGKEIWEYRQKKVKNAFESSWNAYRKSAWGKDQFFPLSKSSKNMGPKPLGWIIVDSLDTMAIMGLDKQLEEARDWVENELDYDMDYEVNTFETTIRMLGGLLSAHYLTKDDLYLNKAVDLGDRLIGAFDSPSGIPYASVNLHTGAGKASHADGGASSTAEAATLQLEFKYLSKLTGEDLYWKKAEKVLQVIEGNQVEAGLVPIYIRADTGQFQGHYIRLGSRGDSYYEYLIKQYLLTGETIYKDMYEEAVEGIKGHLIHQSMPNKLTFIGEREHGIDGTFSNKMDHLVCFTGGMFAIGATGGKLLDEARRDGSWSSTQENDMRLAMEITKSCYETYAQTASGLGPEIVIFNTDESSSHDFYIKPADAHNLQRPETVESLFILWKITGNSIYRQWGWKIFEAFEKWTKLEDGAYVSLDDVRNTPPKFRDNMESFWLAETLKYLYLLFDESETDLLPLSTNVFNTEAHPFPVFQMEPLFHTGWKRTKTDSKEDVDKTVLPKKKGEATD